MITKTIHEWQVFVREQRAAGNGEAVAHIERAINDVLSWPFSQWWRFRENHTRTFRL